MACNVDIEKIQSLTKKAVVLIAEFDIIVGKCCETDEFEISKLKSKLFDIIRLLIDVELKLPYEF